jgi:hypothetical protein
MDELTQIRVFYGEPAPPSPEVIAAARQQNRLPDSPRRRTTHRMLLPVGTVAAATAGALVLTSLTGPPSARAQALAAVDRIGAQSFRVHIDTQDDRGPHSYSAGAFDAARGIGVVRLTDGNGEQRSFGDVVYTEMGGSYMDRKGRRHTFPAQYRWSKLVIQTPKPFDGLLYGFSKNPQRALQQLDRAKEITAAGAAGGSGWRGKRYTFTTPKADGIRAAGTMDVDSTGEIRRVDITWSYAAQNNPAKVAHTIHGLVTFDDFGVGVSVAEPPAAQVIPADLEHYLFTGQHLPPGSPSAGWIPGP